MEEINRPERKNIDVILVDLSYPPFKKYNMDVIFSNSVIRHLDHGKAVTAVRHLTGCLTWHGQIWVQFPNSPKIPSEIRRSKDYKSTKKFPRA